MNRLLREARRLGLALTEAELQRELDRIYAEPLCLDALGLRSMSHGKPDPENRHDGS